LAKHARSARPVQQNAGVETIQLSRFVLPNLLVEGIIDALHKLSQSSARHH
jgi:hypothetical protein